MSWWTSLVFRIQALRHRRRIELEQLEELEFHVDMETEKNQRLGMNPAEARRQARAVFGSVPSHREALRDDRGFPWLEHFASDLKLAFRALGLQALGRQALGLQAQWRSRLFAGVIVLTLAIGIAATSSMFSAVHEVLIRPLPYEEPDRLVVVTSRHTERNIVDANISHPDFLSWQHKTTSFEHLGAYTGWTGALTGAGLAERVSGAALSPEVLRVLGVEPILGRGFLNEEVTDNHRVVLLGHTLWRQRYGARESIVGDVITLDGEPHTVVGVMPAGFRFPYQAEAWVPLAPLEMHQQRGARFLLGAIGRLAGDSRLQQAQQEIERVSDQLALAFPDSNDGWDAELTPLIDNVVGPLGPALMILQAAAALVLLVVCGNVGGLLLARGLQRRQEFAVRTALGAGRRRLVALLMTESLVLAALGALCSLPLLWLCITYLRRLLVDRLDIVSSLTLNPAVLGFALAVSLAATLVFGWLPALGSTRSAGDGLGDTRSGTGRQTSRLRQVFVIAQLALVVVLMVGATLLIRSINAIDAVDPGFEATGILSAQVGLPSSKYTDAESRDAAIDNMLTSLAALPGVDAVAAAQGLPFSGWDVHNYYQVEGDPAPEPGHELVVHVQTTTPGFHQLLGVEHLRGRPLRNDDGRDNSVAVVNESFVERHFSHLDPVGKRFRFGSRPWITIVGVIADYRHFDLITPMRPAVYLPWSAWSPQSAVLTLASSRDWKSLVPELRQALAQVDPDVPPYRIEPFTDAVRRESFNARWVRNLLVGFAGVSVVLALIGLYGVISYSASTRRREFGVRIALGATPPQLAAEIMKQGAGLAACGIVFGLLAALGWTGYLGSLLFEVQAQDPATYVGIGGLALVLATIATWLPARKAARQDPVAAIRSE